MKKHLMIVTGLIMVALTTVSAIPVARSITVSGTVQDSVSGLPIQGALILLFDTDSIGVDLNNLGGLELDSTYSDAEGKFSYKMSVSAMAFIMGYAVVKQNYQVKVSAAPILGTTVNLGVIKLSGTGIGALDTFTVTGKVVDSVDGSPVGGALVVFSGLGALDTSSGNRVLTNADGTFSKQIVITKLNSLSLVGYVVSQIGYVSKVGQGQGSGEQLDFGTIQIVKSGAAVRPSRTVFHAGTRPDGMAVFTMNGRVLYKGPVLSAESALKNRSGELVVVYTRSGRIVESRRMTGAFYR